VSDEVGSSITSSLTLVRQRLGDLDHLLYRGGEQPTSTSRSMRHVQVVEELERLPPHRGAVEERRAAPEDLAAEEEVLDRFQIGTIVELLEDERDTSFLPLADRNGTWSVSRPRRFRRHRPR